jgi:hypothetical protein
MSNPTSSFGWIMPTSTDLVTDLPADFEVFGQAVDTDFQDLLGGTTGQVLSKTSATDLAFTWIDNDQGDITGVTAGTGITVTDPTGPVPTVTNSMATEIDAKGDLIAGTADNAFTRLGVGSNDQVLTADSTEATGMKWAAVSAGGMTLLSTTTLSGVTTTISSISQSYTNLMIEIFGAAGTGGSADQNFYCKLNGSTTGRAVTTAYQNAVVTQGYAFQGILDGNTSTNVTIAGGANAWVINIPDYASTTNRKIASFYGGYNDTTAINGSWNTYSTSAISSIAVGFVTASSNAGTVKIWGIK